VGTANPGGTFGDLGLSWYSGADGSSNAIIDTEGVNRGARFFYRVASTDPNGVVGATSTVTYAMYRQPRAQASTYYWAGIPINYGASNSLDSTLGQHLARGLQRNANPLLADQLTVYYPAQKTFYLNALGQWYEAGVGPATNVLPLGHGVVIERVAGSSSDGRTNAVLTGVALGSFSGSVTIPANRWSFLCWPEDASNRVWSLGGNANDTNPATADRIWMPSRSGRPPKQLRLWTDGWQFEPRTSVNPSNDPIWAYMQAGEGFFHTNSGIQINWAP
jgi:hypothetical protein